MSFGGEFKNDHSIVVISDNRLIETFIGKATYSSAPGRRNGRVRRFTISASTRPLVFVHAKNNRYASIISIVPISGGRYAIDIATNGDQSDLEVYCFAQVPGSNTETSWGMNIYDEAGRPVFSSNWKVLNVRGVVSPPKFEQSVNHGIVGLTKPAAMSPCNSGSSVILRRGTSYVEWDDRDVFQITNTKITTSRVRVWYWDDYYWGAGSPPYDYGTSTNVQNSSASPFPIIDAAQYD